MIYRRLLRNGSIFILSCWAAAAQVSPAAYRALGQVNLTANGVNMVVGVELQTPLGVALDTREGATRLYVCDAGNSRVLAWRDLAGYQIGEPPSLVLGQAGASSSGPYGIGNKGFYAPTGLAVDPRTGDLYVADTGNHRVLRFPSPFLHDTRLEPDAVFGQPDFSTVKAGATASTLNAPRGVAVDPDGNLWVADTGNHRVLRFAAAASSNGSSGADVVIGQADFFSASSNQGGADATASSLYVPWGLAFDANGSLYVADYGNGRILKYSPPFGASAQAASAVFGQRDFASRSIPRQATVSSLQGPVGVAVDDRGNVYAATALDNRVLVFPSTAAGGGGAQMVLGQSDFTTTTPNSGSYPMASPNGLAAPADVKVDAAGNVVIADTGNHRVVRFPLGSRSANAVWGQTDFSANGPNQIKAGSINAAYKMVIDYSQPPYALYVSDTNNNRVLVWRDSARFRSGDPADLVIGQPDMRTAAANVDSRGATPTRTSLSGPTGLAINPYSGTLYVADAGNHRVLRYPRPVDQAGRITPDAVIGQADFTSAAYAAVNASSMNTPSGLAFSRDGNLFVADTGNNRVLEFGPGAGTGAAAIRVYGQPSAFASARPTQVSPQTLLAPRGLFVDDASNLYVVDSGAARVVIYTNTQSAPPAGAPASFAFGGTSAFKKPVDVAVDSAANIYVSDAANNRVLIVSSPVSIDGAQLIGIVGQPDSKSATANYDGSNGGATANGLYGPLGVYVDRQDTLYVGDAGNNRVLHFLKTAAVVNAATFDPAAPVGQGALASLRGNALASDTAIADQGWWPTDLANRQVVLDDETAAPLSMMSPAQTNFQIPGNTPVGTHRIAVRLADTGELVAGGSMVVAAVSPGLFIREAPAQGWIVNDNGSMNSPANPAAVGSTITIYGTGQGPVSPAVPDGQPAPGSPLSATIAAPTADGKACLTTQPSVCVAIGSKFGTIEYSGLAPGSVGLWQIKVTIPQGSAAGSAIPLRAVIGGAPSNIVTVAVK
jgi:uncharacterized protein (TIGR03437 family)